MKLVYQTIPEQLTDCEPAPPLPGPEATQKDVAAWVLKLSEASEDCRSKLLRVRDLTHQ